MGRSPHSSRSETDYPVRRIGSFEYRTSRVGFDDASLMAYRFARRSQERSGPDFVLVHGIGVSATSYGPTAVELTEHGEVHLIDLAGYGRSPRPHRDLSVADHADLVRRYLLEKELDRPVVVGHSMGAQVVAQLAADAPETVDRIVLIAPVVAPDARSLRTLIRLMIANGFREPPWVSVLAVYDYLFRAGIPYMVQQTPHLLQMDMDELATDVAAKTLVICGERDPIVPLEWGRELSTRFAHGGFATVPGPHATMFAAPTEIARLIRAHARS